MDTYDNLGKKSCQYCCHLWLRPRTFQTTHIRSSCWYLCQETAILFLLFAIHRLLNCYICTELSVLQNL